MSSQSQTQATQPEVANYITDIFGADSDDEIDQVPSKQPLPNLHDKDENDAELEDSDDEDTTKRQLKRTLSQSQDKPVVDGDDDDIEDSDDEVIIKSKKEKKYKKKRKEKSGGDEKIKKHREGSSSSSSSMKASTEDKSSNPDRNSGDEYDSGDDAKHTEADDNFIDEDDDLAGVAGEYNQEEQVFNDERPDDYRKEKTKKSSRNSEGGGSSSSRKAGDPFSQTLDYMKKPKEGLMSEAEKDKITEQLLHRMHDAFIKDDIAFKEGKPAVYKLQMLKVVQQVVAIKTLQHNLLEKDILGAFKDWIEPKRDAAKTLPSLSVRTAIYEMLGKLPCQTDHLKRTSGNNKPIGHIIFALKKHDMETRENKILLRQLMDKWSRPVFRKSADARSNTRDAGSAAELNELANQRHAAVAAAHAATRVAGVEGADDREGGDAVDGALSGNSFKGVKDVYLRAKTPYSNGFLFTVPPEAKAVQRKESNEKAFGQTRADLLKKMNETGRIKLKVGGKKLNPRAMDMVMSGRNKA